MHPFHLHARRRRAHGALILLIAGLGALGFSFFQTQVMKNPAYALQSEANRLRPITVPAPRGAIYDRSGAIVAENVPGYTLALLPAPVDSLRRTLEWLAPLVDLTPARIDGLLARFRQHPGEPLIVSHDLSFDQVSSVEEQRPLFPGIFIDMRPKRHYPAGEAIAHLVGYVAEISRAELEMEEFRGYARGRHIGKAGIERRYEHTLAGRPGVRYVEVDAYGRIIGELAPRPAIEPTSGEDMQLHLDLGLQEWIARIFPEGMAGAIVALEPGTANVLALYSTPGYDPNEFVGGVDPELWRALNADPTRPLVHRAVTGLYAPGSTFKLYTAVVAFELGLLGENDRMPLPCRGGMLYGNRYFRCWYSAGHGHLGLAEAIQRSCNVYFYQLGVRIGLERFLQEGVRLGFGGRAGIDLPVERGGIFPTGPEWYRNRFGWDPTPTEALNLAIGQGPVDVTALKLAQFYTALAGDGTAPTPRLATGVEPSAEGGIRLNLTPRQLEALRDGLRRVTAPGGTAHLSSLEHWELAGKTGTAQNPHGPSHGWFVGMAGPRGGEPEIVVAAIVEHGERGSDVAQYVAKTADYYLRRKHGIEVDTVQTLREHLRVGRPAPWARWQ